MDANEFRRLIVNLIRKGSVFAVDLSTNPPTVRVSVGDPEDTNNPGLTTNWIPFFAARAGATREWNPPTVGEQVVLFCPMGDPAQGVALPGIFSDAAPAPAHSADVHTTVYPDGAVMQYDHAAHELSATLPAGATVKVIAPGAVNVTTQTANVKADSITLDGDTIVTKSLTVKGQFAFESGMTGSGGEGKTMTIDGAADFSGEVKSGGVSVPHHSHADPQGGTVGEPI
ncbi:MULTISPECIES: phage baseplate assembly protein V [unclassified Caballeronia]|uniref:phage baseplate assembly protein V n=1 Tax=unclassified Caballeronia TaxID=2646786 RepID=UPI002027F145|nr:MULTISPECIES: phage baseplate assembly protein V [unclassified Caballeronia]MDR5797440.1 phage baseplate assembly protein V [Caballeronia sp. LZ008]